MTENKLGAMPCSGVLTIGNDSEHIFRLVNIRTGMPVGFATPDQLRQRIGSGEEIFISKSHTLCPSCSMADDGVTSLDEFARIIRREDMPRDTRVSILREIQVYKRYLENT